MGNYVFSTEALIDAVTKDAGDPDSKHDMGGNIIPMMVEARRRPSTTSATTRCRAAPTATAATGATWEPSTRSTTRTWT